MLDIVEIFMRNRFLVFAENARSEVLQSPPLCLPGFANRPAEGLLIRCHCHSLGYADRRNSVPRAHRPGDSRARGPWPNAKLAKKRRRAQLLLLQSGGIYFPVTKSSVPETLKKYPCFVEMIAGLAAEGNHHNRRKSRQNLKKY